MKNIKISLSDTNYTEQAATDINLNCKQFELFKSLIQKVEYGLSEQRAAFMAIEGLLDDPVKLTITDYEQSV